MFVEEVTKVLSNKVKYCLNVEIMILNLILKMLFLIFVDCVIFRALNIATKCNEQGMLKICEQKAIDTMIAMYHFTFLPYRKQYNCKGTILGIISVA